MGINERRLLELALELLEERRRGIEAEIAELRKLLGGRRGRPAGGKKAAPGKGGRKRRRMTAAHKKAISERQKQRWAERRKQREAAKAAAAK